MGSTDIKTTSGWHVPRLYEICMVMVLTLATMLLGGCARAESQKNAASNQNAGAQIAAVLETPTAIMGTIPNTTPVGTPTLLPREQKATEIARFNDERQTVVAQATNFALGTPYPRNSPLPPPATRPATTPVPGINTDCANADREFSYVNCWNALIGEQYVFADTGVLKADSLQAVLHVYTGTLDLRNITPKDSYPTSIRTGMMRISSVNWPLMTLTALQGDPPVTLVFNLETRQWISPLSTPGPSPSAFVSPVPSGTPVPTQSP